MHKETPSEWGNILTVDSRRGAPGRITVDPLSDVGFMNFVMLPVTPIGIEMVSDDDDGDSTFVGGLARGAGKTQRKDTATTCLHSFQKLSMQKAISSIIIVTRGSHTQHKKN